MSVPFLDALTSEEAEALRACAMKRAYGSGVTLVHQGDDGGPVIVLLDGRVKVASVTTAGREVIIAVRGRGDLVGELAALDESPRSASILSLEPVEALVIPASAFAAFLERHPRVALVILRMVAGRLRYSDAQQADFATQDVVGRVARRLVELAGRFGETRDGGRIVVELPISQDELAAWCGASREAVAKALQLFRSLKMVETGRRQVTVLDLEGLRRRGM